MLLWLYLFLKQDMSWKLIIYKFREKILIPHTIGCDIGIKVLLTDTNKSKHVKEVSWIKTLERSCEFAGKDTKNVKIETDGILFFSKYIIVICIFKVFQNNFGSRTNIYHLTFITSENFFLWSNNIMYMYNVL